MKYSCKECGKLSEADSLEEIYLLGKLCSSCRAASLARDINSVKVKGKRSDIMVKVFNIFKCHMCNWVSDPLLEHIYKCRTCGSKALAKTKHIDTFTGV